MMMLLGEKVMISRHFSEGMVARTALGALLILSACAPASESAPVYRLTIADSRFEPSQIAIPAETQVKLLVKNTDPDRRFFYSYRLNRAKRVGPGDEEQIFLRPLERGSYEMA